MTSNMHGSQENHDDAPFVRPDGTLPPPQRPISAVIGGTVTIIVLLMLAGVLLLMNYNRESASATNAPAAARSAPESLIEDARITNALDLGSLRVAAVERTLPGPYTQNVAKFAPPPVRPNDERGLIRNALTGAPAQARDPIQGPGTYQDVNGRFTVRLPADWTSDESQQTDWVVVVLNGPSSQSGPFFYIFSEEAADFTLDDYIAVDQKVDRENQKFNIKDGPVTDIRVAGEPAKTFMYSYTAKSKPNATPGTGQVWEINHNSRRFRFAVDPIGASRSDVNAIVASFAFTDRSNGKSQVTPWSDPNGLITLKQPNTWTPSILQDDPTNVLTLTSPEGVVLYLNIDDQFGTVDQEIQGIRDLRAKNTTFKYSLGTVANLKIGGQPGKTSPFTYTMKTSAAVKGSGRDYIVNNNGKVFIMTAANIGDRQADIDAIITSITFGGAGNGTAGQVTPWQDPNHTIQLQYPNGWTPSVDPNDQGNILTLQAPDGEYFYLYAYDTPFDSLDGTLQQVKKNHLNSADYKYTDGQASDLTIGGEPAKALPFKVVLKNNPNMPPKIGKDWIFNHGGNGYFGAGLPLDKYAADIDAIVASITFLT